MNWIRDRLANRRLKREWDEMFYVGALWAYTWKNLSDHLFDHYSLSRYHIEAIRESLPDDYDIDPANNRGHTTLARH